MRGLGVDEDLRRQFWHLKSGAMVVYPMETQMRLLIDAAAIGEHRVFGVEALSADPLFVHLAGGVVPSLDTIYRDLRRFDDPAIAVALRSPAFYLGCLVSARTHARRVERPKAAGFGEADIARFHAPIGADIGARSPAEIAVAILAEITERLRRPATRP